MDNLLSAQTEEDFSKARNRALFNDIQHFLQPAETKLLSFTDIKKWLKPKTEIYVGMKEIPVDHIVGSEGRYNDFDNHFFPKAPHLKSRWKSIDAARLSDIILPPIKLYEIGGLYFVRDGNHRVSVARSQGVAYIDGEVISLQSEIKLRPGMSKNQILKKVLEYEKRLFYAETAFGDITDCWNLDFSSPGQYDVIYNHIQIHKYYINENQKEEISMVDAIASWYTQVYEPVITTVQKQKILKKFRKRTSGDMYVWLIRYWHDLKEKYGEDISLDAAARDFKSFHKKNIFTRFCEFLFRKNDSAT
ncbi:MAG: transcriptional regulator [Spirochaetales bacterium]